LPATAAIRPLFIILLVTKLRLFAACITGSAPTTPWGNALVIVPPAVTPKFAELKMVPAFTILFAATRFKFKLELISPPVWLKILRAEMVAVFTAGFIWFTRILPAFVRLPVRFRAEALFKTETP
jgi:hypothetical protein